MHKEEQTKKVKSEKNKFMVSINPNVDYAFVVALLAIVDAMNSVDSGGIISEVTSQVVGAAVGA